MRRNIVIPETVGHGQSGLLNPTSPMTAEKYKKEMRYRNWQRILFCASGWA